MKHSIPKLEVMASLNLNAEEMVDSRNGVSVLRLIPGMETFGRIDMSYGPEESGSIHIDIDDLSSFEVKDFETFDGVVTEFQGNPNRDGDWTVTFPTYDVEKAMGAWYINGTEIDSDMIGKSVRGDHTTFMVPEMFFSSGSNVVSCLFIYDSGRIGDYTVNVNYHPYTGEEPSL